ncbi:MAG: BA14K family protein [Bradyrhizobium sp.]|nr:BA14K family protein [Bradyrhizobium sp.]
MELSRMISAAVLAAATSVASLQPVAAAPLMVAPGIGKSVANVETVQYRGWRRGPGWHHRGWHHGYYGNGAAIGGLAAGAIIGGAIANSQARAAQADAYCSQRYKSYDPASGTYLGYDGARHPCP